MARKVKIAPETRIVKPLPPLEPIVIAPSEQFRSAVLEEIRAMEQARRNAKRLPEHILYRELERHLASALNALYTEGRLTVGLTINDKYLRTTETTENATTQD